MRTSMELVCSNKLKMSLGQHFHQKVPLILFHLTILYTNQLLYVLAPEVHVRSTKIYSDDHSKEFLWKLLHLRTGIALIALYQMPFTFPGKTNCVYLPHLCQLDSI